MPRNAASASRFELVEPRHQRARQRNSPVGKWMIGRPSRQFEPLRMRGTGGDFYPVFLGIAHAELGIDYRQRRSASFGIVAARLNRWLALLISAFNASSLVPASGGMSPASSSRLKAASCAGSARVFASCAMSQGSIRKAPTPLESPAAALAAIIPPMLWP